ncbi:hypothetical protein [Chthonobacter albigriseus]|uniref:hypothetical protein n=1 Tax=Chthonobacter albigriseus TaxID=1683161 RepID=UPI0015EF3B93|nr:hypothetical protein [Chthonobacter albigriseus]
MIDGFDLPFDDEADALLPTSPPIATLAVVVDCSDTDEALAAIRAFATANGFDVLAGGAEPYDKLGPHARVWLHLRLPACRTNREAADLAERLAARVCDPAHLAAELPTVFYEEDGSMHYERIFDSRMHPVILPRALWLNLELDTGAGPQRDLAVASGMR